jgi:hypothetical protein
MRPITAFAARPRRWMRFQEPSGLHRSLQTGLRCFPYPSRFTAGGLRKREWLFLYVITALVLMGFAARGGAQTAPGEAPRITAPIDETTLTRLAGNTHPLARPRYDRGAIPDSQPLHRMLLLLKRSADQEAALRALLDQQQSQASPNYHRWLTPQEFGQKFGPADADVQKVSGWLQSHGFQVAHVSAGKTVIEFSGNAGQVRNAFQTEIHRYAVNGQEHFANASDPQIPTALTPVVAGTVSLHNFARKPQSRIAGVFTRSNASGVVKRSKARNELANGNAAGADFTFSSMVCPLNNCFALGPTDFATIYNVTPLWASGIKGSGQTIAIVGDSEICTANSPDFNTSFVGPFGTTVTCNSDDVATFRSLFGLTANSPNVIVDGPDPGFNGDETEGDLDVEWAGAIAPSATIDFVIAEDTETSAGVDLAAEYAVDNNLAPVLSESFGACEEFLGSANQFFSGLWEQAAAQGITVVVSAGDSGSAGCDDPGLFPSASQFGQAVNGIASTPFNVAAGGTDFDITATNYPSAYWNPGNISPTEASAKSYIPETPWNDSCAQNFTGSVAACDSPTLNGLAVVGGGGGESNCVFPNGQSCLGYAKPTWQSGPYVTGMASTDGVRDLPDISFFAADGFISGSFYIVCQADLDVSDAPCSLNSTSAFTTFIGVGGTSSSAPTFAGVMALVNQQETTLHAGNPAIPTRQGNANYVLYALANAQKNGNLSCSSSTGPAVGCTFNDVIRGNNSVPCYSGATNCNATSPNPYGLLEPTDSAGNLTGTIAYNSGTGYDLATGLGTINVTNLVNNWQSAVGKFTPTMTTLKMCAPASSCIPGPGPITITHGALVESNVTVAPTSGSGTPTGNIAFVFVASVGTLPQSGLGTFTLLAGSISPVLSSLPGGTYSVTAHYTGDGSFGASDSTAITATVTPEATTTTLTAPILNFVNQTITQTLTTPSGGTIDFGDAVYLRADVAGLSGQGKATGSVTFKDGGTTLGVVPLNAEGYAELQMGANIFGSPLKSLAVGTTHNITATYNGDASYSTSASSSALPITVVAAPTTISVQASATNIPPSSSITVSPNTMVTLTAFIDTQSSSNPSGGSFANAQAGTELLGNVTFTVGNNTLGSSSLSLAMATVDSNGFIAAQVPIPFAPAAAQNLTINATYIPSTGNYRGSSTTSAVTVNVGNNEGFTITPAVATADCSNGTCINVAAAGQTATSPVTVTSIGLSGTVTLSCTVSPFNPADVQIPGCSFTLNGAANSTVSLSGNGSSGQRMLTITTTARSVLVSPAIRPQGGDWVLAGAILSLGCAFLLLNVRTRKVSPAATFALMLVMVAGVAIGCGGGGSGNTSAMSGLPPAGSGTGGSGSGASGSGGSGGGGTGGGGTGGGGAMSNPGTTADVYFVTVTATPSTGTAIQTQFVVFVQ